MFIVSVSVLLSVFVFWHYWRKFKPYVTFRNYLFCDWELVPMAILGKYPDNVSRNAFTFQKIVNNCEKFQVEGVYAMLFPWPAFFVYGVEAVKFFANESSVINKPEIFYKFFDLINSNSLFRSNRKRMKKQRKMIGPAFYPKILKDIMIVMNEHAACLTEELRQLENSTTNDLGMIMEFRTLKLFFETSLEIKPESADKDGRVTKFLHLMPKYIDYVMYRMFNPWLYFDFALNVSKEGRAHLKRREKMKLILKEIADDLVNSYNSKIPSKKHDDANLLPDIPHRKSFGEILIEEHADDPSFTQKDLKMELTTLIIAGYDTVSLGLTWTMWLLGQNERVQEKAYEEIKSIAVDFVRYEDMHNLKYLDCIIKESLRLYPVAPVFGRYSDKDLQFGKYTIYSGTPIVFLSYALHRNPDLYPDPEIFKPERFAESESNVNRWAQIPFAEGVRSCIGKNYAMLLLKCFLVNVIRNFRLLSLTQKEDIEVTWSMMLRSSKPIAMKFIPR